MGMFDTVSLACPHCGERTEFQTKAGQCLGMNYEIESVPARIAESLSERAVTCTSCDQPIFFSAKVVVTIEATKNNPEREIESDFESDD